MPVGDTYRSGELLKDALAKIRKKYFKLMVAKDYSRFHHRTQMAITILVDKLYLTASSTIIRRTTDVIVDHFNELLSLTLKQGRKSRIDLQTYQLVVTELCHVLLKCLPRFNKADRLVIYSILEKINRDKITAKIADKLYSQIIYPLIDKILLAGLKL